MFGNSKTFLFNPPGMNNFGNNWMMGYTAFNKDVATQIPVNPQMYNVVFKTSVGQKFNIPFSENRTVEDLIETFFKRVDREELFQKSEIAFLYNAAQIKYHDKSKIKQIFRINYHPTVIAIDVKGLIGA